MPYSVEGKLVVAISSRAMLDFEDENRIFERDGEDAYIALQFARLDVPAREGVAFPLVKKLLAFNTPQAQRVEVVILSKNDPVSGLRVFRSAERAGLRLERGVFTRGANPYRYLDALKANLFLSANENDVMSALDSKVPAVRTLMEWNIAVDEAMFLGGLDKGAFLKAFEPDFYFDDQRGHVDSARAHVAAGHVPFGVANLR